MMDQSVLAVIPARGGSKGLPGKNIRLLQGKPLIWHTIQQARASKCLQKVVLSTEDDRIAQMAAGYGVQVIRRPPELARDDTPTLPVLQHAVKYLEEFESERYGAVILLQPTSPLRKAEDIDRAFDMFLQTGCGCVVSVCELEHPAHWMYTIQQGQLRPLLPGAAEIKRRQDAPKVYRLNGAVYVTRIDTIMVEHKVIGDNARPYIMPPERSIDIDTELDLQLAELIMEQAKSDR